MRQKSNQLGNPRLNRDAMKELKEIRLLSLLAALGLLYVGIIVDGDPLSRIQRILTIVVGTLLSTLASASLWLPGEAAFLQPQ
ncbi:MAG: hypothetical protein WB607_02345 [Candidatus Acidiferrum sp.]